MSRKYPSKDIKILWGLSAGYCAFPNCYQLCIAEASEYDPAAVIGEIAHIQAYSDIGPRANPNLTSVERDCYDNWILLCRNHHRRIDLQASTYTAENLQSWKLDLENWVRNRLTENMAGVGFAELEIVTKGILSVPEPPSSDFASLDPKAKMERNNLTDKVHFLITLGFAKFKEVETYVENIALIDSQFPERLKAGFIIEYNRLIEAGFEGDSLFEALREFAYGRSRDFQQQAAGLAVLTYLFQKCEIFKK